MALITSVAHTHSRQGIDPSNKLVLVFLFTFLLASLGQIGFSCYVMNRQLQAAPNSFDPSIIHHLNKKLVLAGLLAGVLGMVITMWAVALLRCGRSMAKVVVPGLWLIAAFILAAGYWFLARTEKRYLFRSRYFALYLCIAVPLAISMIAGLWGMIGLYRRRR